jgi:hypothetical protein
MYECGYKPWELNYILMRDVYLLMEGRKNYTDQHLRIVKHQTATLSDVISKSMTGQSSYELVAGTFEGREPAPGLTAKDVKEIIEQRKKYLASGGRKDRN